MRSTEFLKYIFMLIMFLEYYIFMTGSNEFIVLNFFLLISVSVYKTLFMNRLECRIEYMQVFDLSIIFENISQIRFLFNF